MELDDLEKNLLELAKDFENGKSAKEFLRKCGNKLKNETVKVAKSKVKDKTGNYIKSIKRGKVYEFKGAYSIRAYSGAPHAHLIEYGHIKKSRDGKERGYEPGRYVFEEASKNFTKEYEKEVKDFIDETVDKFDLS